MLGHGALGRRASDGTQRTVLRPVGGTCPPEELLPQGKDGSPRRFVRAWEGGGRLRKPNADHPPECTARTGSAPQGSFDLPKSRGMTPLAVRQDLRSLGTVGRSVAPAGRGTHSRSELPHPLRPPPLNAQLSTTTEKNKKLPFLDRICLLRRPLRGAQDGVERARHSNSAALLIAQ